MNCNSPCCCCYTSPKGASFFCTSIHIFIGLYLTSKWVLVTYVNGLNDNLFEDHRMNVIYPMLLLYLSIFLVVGLINFISVERESPSILKWTMRVFLLLQLSMLLTNTLLAFALPEMDTDLALHRFHHCKYIVINAAASSIYFFVIWRFVHSLENGIYVVHKKRRKRRSGSGTRATPGPSRSIPTAPWSTGTSTVGSGVANPTDTHRREEDEQTLPLKSILVKPQSSSSKKLEG